MKITTTMVMMICSAPYTRKNKETGGLYNLYYRLVLKYDKAESVCSFVHI